MSSTFKSPVILASPNTYSAVAPVDTVERTSNGNVGFVVPTPTRIVPPPPEMAVSVSPPGPTSNLSVTDERPET